jgi:lysophospholipase L1-like esterase
MASRRRTPGRTLRLFAVAVTSALALLVPAASAAPAAPSPKGAYVALGDSYTAGPVIPVQQSDPLGCLRSDHNYPHLIASSLGVTGLRDASCSGAKTDDMTAPQNVTPGPNPPQFSKLGPDAKVVTLGIGGNDIGFTEIIENCSSPTPLGHPCQDQYVAPDGTDIISGRIRATAPKVAAVLQGIRQRSPAARIFVVGYLAILPESGNGCWPQMPLAYEDVPYLRAKEHELNAMLATQAQRARVTFVDTYTPSIGHDACQLPTVRWVEPVVPNAPAAPVHPNATGMQATARFVLAAASRR